jgi:Protein of unknown function (DUF1553)/Protein of unknown function (DUF1549)
MKKILVVLWVLVLLSVGRADEAGVVLPFEAAGAFRARNAIDRAAQAGWKNEGLSPARPCSDEVFVRRVYLDVIGTLPEPRAVVEFLRDRRPGKRALLIDRLLDRDEFADYWAQKWGDILRVKAEFPINLWPNAVQAYHRFIHDALARNMPYDEFARALLTATGSNFRVPPVNFCRAVQDRSAKGLAQVAALTFMGTRVEHWPEDRRAGLEVFFSRVAFKKTSEWKEEIVFLSPEPVPSMSALLPDGTTAHIAPDEDPRRVFANWLIRKDNGWFARSIANRVWAWLMGRGIVDEPDDFRPDNPPSNPALLDCLVEELVGADFDLKHLYRVILNSGTYQQSPLPRGRHPRSEALFAHYLVRPLGAEVLIDALCGITGSSEKYMSPIPEPFTNIPEDQRTITLADGSITSPFLEMFGRPSRDTGLESERNPAPTGAQRLHLLNSTDIQRRIEQSGRLNGLIVRSRGRQDEVIRGIYLVILSRLPTPREVEVVQKYVGAGRRGPGAKAAAADLAWALINTKEFLCRH